MSSGVRRINPNSTRANDSSLYHAKVIFHDVQTGRLYKQTLTGFGAYLLFPPTSDVL